MQKYSDDFHAKDDIKRLIRLAEILFQKGDYQEAMETMELAAKETRELMERGDD
jgi:predicted negative regulator of RcsB-dependent stress response